MSTSTSVSVGHGPGTPRNEGTAKDRSTPVPDSNLTEIEATQEPGQNPDPRATASRQGEKIPSPPTNKAGPAQPR